MARPESRVSIGSFVDPLEGIQGAVGSLADRYVKDVESKREQARWDITNKRAQAKHDTEIAEVDRAKQQRDILNQYSPEAIRTIQPSTIARDKELLGQMATGAKEGFEAAENRLLASDTGFKALGEEIKAADAARVPGTIDTDEAMKAKREAYRNRVLDYGVPGVAGVNVRDALVSGYQGYDVTKEEAEQAMRSRLMERGLDFDAANTMAKSSSESFKSREAIQKERDAMRRAALEGSQTLFENQVKLGTLDKKYSGSGSKGSAKSPEDFLKLAESVVGEGSMALTGLTDKQTRDESYQAYNRLKDQGLSNDDAVRAITTAMIREKDEGFTGVKLDKDRFNARINSIASSMKKSPGYTGRIALPGSPAATGSFEDARREKALGSIKSLRDLLGTAPAVNVPASTTPVAGTPVSRPDVVEDNLTRAAQEQSAMEALSPIGRQELVTKEVRKVAKSDEPFKGANREVLGSFVESLEDKSPGNISEELYNKPYYELGKKDKSTVDNMRRDFFMKQEYKQNMDVLNAIGNAVPNYYNNYVAPLGRQMLDVLPSMPSGGSLYSTDLLTPEQKTIIRESSR